MSETKQNPIDQRCAELGITRNVLAARMADHTGLPIAEMADAVDRISQSLTESGLCRSFKAREFTALTVALQTTADYLLSIDANPTPRLITDSERISHLEFELTALQKDGPRCKLCKKTWPDHVCQAACKGEFPSWLHDPFCQAVDVALQARALSAWMPKQSPHPDYEALEAKLQTALGRIEELKNSERLLEADTSRWLEWAEKEVGDEAQLSGVETASEMRQELSRRLAEVRAPIHGSALLTRNLKLTEQLTQLRADHEVASKAHAATVTELERKLRETDAAREKWRASAENLSDRLHHKERQLAELRSPIPDPLKLTTSEQHRLMRTVLDFADSDRDGRSPPVIAFVESLIAARVLKPMTEAEVGEVYERLNSERSTNWQYRGSAQRAHMVDLVNACRVGIGAPQQEPVCSFCGGGYWVCGTHATGPHPDKSECFPPWYASLVERANRTAAQLDHAQSALAFIQLTLQGKPLRALADEQAAWRKNWSVACDLAVVASKPTPAPVTPGAEMTLEEAARFSGLCSEWEEALPRNATKRWQAVLDCVNTMLAARVQKTTPVPKMDVRGLCGRLKDAQAEVTLKLGEPGSLVKHQHGGSYRLVSVALDESSLRPVVVYADDELTWVRDQAEFLQRFSKAWQPGPVTAAVPQQPARHEAGELSSDEFTEVWHRSCREANATLQNEEWWVARDFLPDPQAMAMFRLVAKHARALAAIPQQPVGAELAREECLELGRIVREWEQCGNADEVESKWRAVCNHVAALRAPLVSEVAATKQALDDVTALEFGWHERTLPTPQRIKFLIELLRKQLSDTQDEVVSQKELIHEWEEWATELGEVEADKVPDWASVRESIGLAHFSLHRIAASLGFESVGFEHDHDPADVADKVEILLTGSTPAEPTEEEFRAWLMGHIDGKIIYAVGDVETLRNAFRAARAGVRVRLRELGIEEICRIGNATLTLELSSDWKIGIDNQYEFARAILATAQEQAK